MFKKVDIKEIYIYKLVFIVINLIFTFQRYNVRRRSYRRDLAVLTDFGCIPNDALLPTECTTRCVGTNRSRAVCSALV